jgi:hypothetical protein
VYLVHALVAPGGHTDVNRSPLYPYVHVNAVAGCPTVTGSLETLATCGEPAPLGVDHVRCNARPETLSVTVDNTPPT